MSVIGLDIGNENCVIAAAKQGGIDVIQNEESNREIPAVVSFRERQRFIGAVGASSSTMIPASTVSQIKRLIGRDLPPSELESLSHATSPPPSWQASATRPPDGRFLIAPDWKELFTPVQVLAPLLEIAQPTPLPEIAWAAYLPC